jgi:hypothetical protein
MFSSRAPGQTRPLLSGSRRSSRREAVDSADIPVEHLPKMKREVDLGNWLAGLSSRGIQPVDRVHGLSRGIERLAADLMARRIHTGKGREHPIAEEFQHLAAPRAQQGGKRFEDLVEQLNDNEPGRCVGNRGEAADIGIPQHSVDTLDIPVEHLPNPTLTVLP